MPTNYFGNNWSETTIDGVGYWTIKTTLPGKNVADACGIAEKRLPKSQYHQPELIGPGCDPVVDRFIVREIVQDEYPKKEYPAADDQSDAEQKKPDQKREA